MSRKILGINDGRRPRIPVFFVVETLQANKLVWFLVDTGSCFSALNESEALLMGLDLAVLPYVKGESIGFGGYFKPRTINRPVKLIFQTADNGQYSLQQSGFRIISPEHTDEETRRKIVELTPCVLGMDILNKFEIHIYSKRIELIPYEDQE